MPSFVTPAIPASLFVDVVPSVLAPGGSPLQFWGMLIDDNLDAHGYPTMPMGTLQLFANASDVAGYFGPTSQEAGLGDVYFQAPINATMVPSGLLATPYALNEVPGFLRSGSLAATSLAALQTVNASLTISIDGSPITENINLSTATSFSNAAALMGFQLGIHGIQLGTCNASLTASGSLLTVNAFTTSNSQGVQAAEVTANLSGTTMTVTGVTGGYLAPGMLVSGTGITAGTTIASWNGTGVSGGVGSYTLSGAATTETGVTITGFQAQPVLQVGQVVTGTGIVTGTYITGFGTGSGGAGTYTLSQAPTTESAETVTIYAPGVWYSATHNAFNIHSGTLGANSSVSFGTGAAAPSLLLTQGTGAIQSPGSAASSPAAFMDAILAITQDWVSFMTTWEPTDADKATGGLTGSFAGWNSAQGNQYRYAMWSTNVLDTESNGGGAAELAIVNDSYSGTVMIYTNPALTTLMGEKAAFAMGWAASLNFTRLNGRQNIAYKSYAGGAPDITSGSIAEILGGSPQTGTVGYGINYYGNVTTRSQGFPQYQRGMISGPFAWDDSYVNQIWLNNALQNDIMVGLTANAGSIPYANPGYALIESFCLDAILAAVNFGAITAGVQLSQEQIQEVNNAAGIQIDQTLTQRGWYLQVLPAAPSVRATRSSPPCTLWYTDGGQIQAILLASIAVT